MPEESHGQQGPMHGQQGPRSTPSLLIDMRWLLRRVCVLMAAVLVVRVYLTYRDHAQETLRYGPLLYQTEHVECVFQWSSVLFMLYMLV